MNLFYQIHVEFFHLQRIFLLLPEKFIPEPADKINFPFVVCPKSSIDGNMVINTSNNFFMVFVCLVEV